MGESVMKRTIFFLLSMFVSAGRAATHDRLATSFFTAMVSSFGFGKEYRVTGASVSPDGMIVVTWREGESEGRCSFTNDSLRTRPCYREKLIAFCNEILAAKDCALLKGALTGTDIDRVMEQQGAFIESLVTAWGTYNRTPERMS